MESESGKREGLVEEAKGKNAEICLRPLRNPNQTTPSRPRKAPAQIVRFWAVSRGFCTRGGSGATGWPFRRNGITVPAQRHHRSGATASPFRRNGVAVPVLYTINSAGRQRLPQRSATRFARAPLPKVETAVPCGPPRLYPLVGAAVPCRPSRPQPKGRGGSPLPPASPLPPGRGGSPLPPARHSDREAVYLKAVRLCSGAEPAKHLAKR